MTHIDTDRHANCCAEPLDVWLRFESPDDEDASHEANIYPHGERFRIEWYSNAVGLVSYLYYDTYAEAAAKLEADGYQDFSTGS